MEEQKVYTLLQWNEYYHVHHLEVSIATENASIRLKCTQDSIPDGKVCGAHYRNICYTIKNDERVVLIECNACGHFGFRKLGKLPMMNGKDHGQ